MYVYVYVYMYVCMYVCIYGSIYLCMYVYVYILGFHAADSRHRYLVCETQSLREKKEKGI